MPPEFHHTLFLFFKHCYKQQQIHASWKTSLTVLLYKKGDPSQLTNHRPIALANTIYKLFTSTLTSILSAYGERHQILHDSQEGFHTERCTSRQIQLLTTALEDAPLTNQDIYLLYIDFKNAFGSIDHARLLAIMTNLGYLEDVVHLIGNIYSHSHTIYTGEHFGHTPKISIQRGTIQGDTLSPYLFLIFLEPLLRWLQKGHHTRHHGYTFGTSKSTVNTAAYADDLTIITKSLSTIKQQLQKLDHFCVWAGMDLSIPKCALTGCPKKSKTTPLVFKALLHATNVTYRNQPIPVLNQHEPYTYLGIHLVPSLSSNIQTYATSTKLTKQCSQLITYPATIKQKISMLDTVIRAGIAYSFYGVPFSLPTIIKLDKKLISLQKKLCGLPNFTPNVDIQLPHHMFGIKAFSLKNAYLRCIGEQLRHAQNDSDKLGIIYRGLTHFILAKYGGVKTLLRLTPHSCLKSLSSRILYLLKTSGGTHLRSTLSDFPLQVTPLERLWLPLSAELTPHISPFQSQKLLHKLLLHNIYDITHQILLDGLTLMSPIDFKNYYTTPTTLLKQHYNKSSPM